MDDYSDGRDETKRKSRNQSEKKRRDQFNVLVSELSSMVSSDGGANNRKMDKTTVLLETIAMLKQHGENARAQGNAHNRDSDGSTIASEWKPHYLSDEEFVHLMLEAIDGFVLVISIEDRGRILYASEGVAWLLGHIPSNILENNTTIFDLTAEEDSPQLKETLSERNYEKSLEASLDDETRPQMEIYVHMEKGGANKVKSPDLESEPGRSMDMHELVKLSGYFAKWSHTPHDTSLTSSSHCDAKNCTDEHCLPGSEDESASIKSGASSHSHASKNHLPIGTTNSSATFKMEPMSSQAVFICTARLMTPQLVREMPVVHQQSAKGEFTSRFSLEWKFLDLDNRAPPIIGYLNFEVLGTSGYDYYHPDDLDRIVQCHESLGKTGEATSLHRFLTKGQQWIWLQTRYFITYHQWNSKPEFVFATHHVISYDDVVTQLKQRSSGSPQKIRRSQDINFDSNHGNNHGQASVNSDHKTSSYSAAPASPTWSSKSCGSTGTGMTSRQSQSSCRLSSYSEHQGPGASSIAASIAAAATVASAQRTAAAAAAAAAAQESQDQMSYYHNNSSSNMELEPIPAAEAFAMDTFDLGIPDNPPMQRNSEIMQTNQPSQIYMTPMQMRMYQQLKAKHSDLCKAILNQQEELRRISEQMLMTQYGLVPVSMAPVSQPTLVVSAHPTMMAATSGSLPQAQSLVHQPHQPQPMFGALEMPTMGYAVQTQHMPPRSQYR